MPIKKLAERSTFSCNQKFDKFLEKKISIWPLQFRNAIGSKSLGIRTYIFTKRKYAVNWRCTFEVWENKVLHEFMTPSWLDLNWIKILVQVNLCQKLLFLHQLTHSMMTDCSLNYEFNTWKFQAQNMGRACCVQKLFLTFRTISVHNIFSPCSAKIRPPDKNLPVTTSHFRGKGETSYFLLNSVVNCEKNDNKHSLIRSVKNEFLDKFQAKRLLMQSRR